MKVRDSENNTFPFQNHPQLTFRITFPFVQAFIVLLSLAVALVASAVIPESVVDDGRANQGLDRELVRSRRSVGWGGEHDHHHHEEHVKEVHVTKTVHVPYPVEKKVPVIVEKKVPVYIKEKPKPIKIKIKRTKHSHSG